jgi:hypothetical protein
VFEVMSAGVSDPLVIGRAVREAMAAGDPNRDQLTLWPGTND